MWALWLLITSSRSLQSLQASLTLVCSSLNVCTASRASIARQIVRQVSIIKIRPARDVVSLGTAFAAGTRRTTKKTKARLRAFLNRRRRFKALSRAKVSVARMLRTGGTCALTYGNRPLGVSDSLLLAQRRAVAAAACTNHCGAELNVSLVIADAWNGHLADPAFEAHVGVALMWSLGHLRTLGEHRGCSVSHCQHPRQVSRQDGVGQGVWSCRSNHCYTQAYWMICY